MHNAWPFLQPVRPQWLGSQAQMEPCLCKPLSSQRRASAQIRHPAQPGPLRRRAVRLRKMCVQPQRGHKYTHRPTSSPMQWQIHAFLSANIQRVPLKLDCSVGNSKLGANLEFQSLTSTFFAPSHASVTLLRVHPTSSHTAPHHCAYITSKEEKSVSRATHGR